MLPSKGAGRIGGRSCDLVFFCTSICEMRMPGPLAETGTAAGLGSADPVEYGLFVIGGDDFAEDGERCADQIHSAHKLFSPIGIDAIDHDGKHLEGVGECTAQ